MTQREMAVLVASILQRSGRFDEVTAHANDGDSRGPYVNVDDVWILQLEEW